MITVVVSGPADPSALRAIQALASLWAIEIRPDAPQERDRAAGIIFVEAAARLSSQPADLPFLAFTSGETAAPRDRHVIFARHPGIPAPIQAQSLLSTEPVSCLIPPPVPGFTTAATLDGATIWQSAVSARGTSYVVATPPPRLEAGQRVAQVLNGETFLHALPLWLFLQSIAARPLWTPPPLRACLVVDDPNLHGTGYGCMDYRRMVEFARKHPFHCGIATVPLDGWRVSRRSARFFQEHASVLSLMAHGNDHLHHELAQPWSEASGRALVNQSLVRIGDIERRAGLDIDRVMAPPHGVCSPLIMDLLWRNGYEGMTTNRWSLWKHTPPAALPADFGLRPADILAGGLPVLPRFRFKSPIGRNEIRLAAVFGQPIIPYGHHQDFSGNMADVAETVDAVNSLGPVRWTNIGEILKTNFETRPEGNLLNIRPYSRHVTGELPPDVTQLQVELPPGHSSDGQDLHFKWHGPDGSVQAAGRAGQPISLPAGARFEVRLDSPPVRAVESGLRYFSRPRALLKRIASEARDRLRL